jgi:hypothetical protein
MRWKQVVRFNTAFSHCFLMPVVPFGCPFAFGRLNGDPAQQGGLAATGIAQDEQAVGAGAQGIEEGIGGKLDASNAQWIVFCERQRDVRDLQFLFGFGFVQLVMANEELDMVAALDDRLAVVLFKRDVALRLFADELLKLAVVFRILASIADKPVLVPWQFGELRNECPGGFR